MWTGLTIAASLASGLIGWALGYWAGNDDGQLSVWQCWPWQTERRVKK